MPSPSPTANLEMVLYRRDASLYAVDLRSWPADSAGEMAPVRGTATFDLPKLQAVGWDGAEAIGRALTKGLFSDPNVLAHYQQARTSAETAGAVLRIRLFIDPTAPELHPLKWELLRDPIGGKMLATRERVLFSRYLGGEDWRPVKPRPKEGIRALVAIADPRGLEPAQFSRVDVEGERKRARDALGGFPIVEVIRPCTFSGLVDQLREGFDILYLVAHGVIVDGEALLWLESCDGEAKSCRGEDLVDRLGQLGRPPQLVVLASCQSGDLGAPADEGDAHAALGPKMAEAGIPAVVAMQGSVSMTTVERFMPEFFRVLYREGRIDQAMAAARFEVRDRPDAASPVLFLRLRDGLMWYVPGFGREPGQAPENHWPELLGDAGPGERRGPPPSSEFDRWPALIAYLDQRRPKATPILGPGLLEPYVGSAGELARRLARNNRLPPAPYGHEGLPRVAQRLSTRFTASELRSMYQSELMRALEAHLGRDSMGRPDSATTSGLLSEAGARRRSENPADPHRVLAALPFPVYVTANPDRLLLDALHEAGRCPEIDACPWNERLEIVDSVFRREPDFYPTADHPLVYYLFGRLEDPASLVLTEDDYFDYLIGLTRFDELIPAVVRRALVDTALLFFGFGLDDWDFRVLVRNLAARPGWSRAARRYMHFAVQIDPGETRDRDPGGVRRLIPHDLGEDAMRTYWGSVDDFARELIGRWAERSDSSRGGRS